jgi:hypothetical protein
MYSDSDLDAAVAAGRLTPEAADALRGHVAELRHVPLADEEQFRLVTSFNDIFVTIAGVLVLIGAGWLGATIIGPLAGLAVAAASWGMSEYFTRQRRMALPSIVFFLSFVGGCYATVMIGYLVAVGGPAAHNWFDAATSRGMVLSGVVAAAAVVGASWLHWRRFMVPISVAAGVAAIARCFYTLVLWAAWPDLGRWTLVVVLLGGLAVFAYAMRWDMADLDRKTRRADVAFWLHLFAAPMIVHPVFMLLGLGMLGDFTHNAAGAEAAGVPLALAALALYALLAGIAVLIDRRAILVSALVYMIIAAIYLARAAGAENVGFAAAVLVIGSALLMLSAMWQTLRRKVLPLVPAGWRAHLPPAR